MSQFQQIRIEYEDQLQKRKWTMGTEDWDEYKKEHQLKNAALNTLEDLFNKVGKNKFLQLASSAISIDNGCCSPNRLFNEDENTELEKKYNQELKEFNKNFLMKNLSNFPIEKILKFLSDSLAFGELSKEFIDAMKLSPDAPIEYRESLKKGFWSLKKDVVEDKKWYEIEELKDNEEDTIQTANIFALQNDFEKAIQIFKSILNETNESSIFPKIILCHLANEDVIDAKMNLDRWNITDKEFYEKLISCVGSYDEINFVKLLRENNEIIEFENWYVTMLLKIKQSSFSKIY
jgi:hypothetical protein